MASRRSILKFILGTLLFALVGSVLVRSRTRLQGRSILGKDWIDMPVPNFQMNEAQHVWFRQDGTYVVTEPEQKRRSGSWRMLREPVSKVRGPGQFKVGTLVIKNEWYCTQQELAETTKGLKVDVRPVHCPVYELDGSRRLILSQEKLYEPGKPWPLFLSRRSPPSALDIWEQDFMENYVPVDFTRP